ncbi:MAG TPA: RHS repeat-associated core domain-containing protein, partial [Acidimicrobiales bacterium]|nr:RHS repeat-associated core domain-containing protein [Acidimicrobiales bacterium]
GGTSAFGYDTFGHLVSATTPAGSATYSYDGVGELLSSTSSAITTSYLPDPASASSYFATYGNTGTLQGHSLTGELGLSGSVAASGAAAFYDSDASGNVIDATGTTGSVTSSATFDPFGNLLSGSAAGSFGFAGTVGAAAQPTGLVFDKARFYDPALGRFLTPDPSGERGVDPYTYALNSPMALVDATGRNPTYWIDPFGGYSTPPSGPSSNPTINTAIAATNAVTGPTSPAGFVPGAMNVGAYGLALLNGQSVGSLVLGGITPLTPASTFHTAAGNMSTAFSAIGATTSAYSAYKDFSNGDNLSGVEDVGNVIVNITTAPMPPPLSAFISATAWAAGVDGRLLGSWWSQPDPPQWGFRIRGKFPPGFIPVGATHSTNLFDADPNNIFGPNGQGSAGWITDDGTTLPYEVTFENDKTATAPVQVATITETLGSGFDPTTFRFGRIGFGSVSASPPSGADSWTITVPDTSTVSVRVQGALDATSGKLTWVFTAVDPATGQKVSDPAAGFLPPDVTP